MSDNYSVKDMQQMMMSEQKTQREILDKQTATLNAIDQHLVQLNGKVARHQEVLFEKDRGHVDRLTNIENWKLKIVGGAVAISTLSGVFVQLLFKLFL